MTTIAMVGYDGGRIAAESLADHVIVVRSEHIPRIQEAQASAYHTLRGAGCEGPRAGHGRRAGRRVPAVRVRAGTELGLSGFVLNDARGVLVEVEGDGGRRLPGAAARGRAAAGVDRVRSCEPIPERRRARASPSASQRRRRARTRRSPPTPPPAPTAWPSSSTRPTAATATRSSTAPTAARGSRSSPASRTTARRRRWPAS